MLKRQFTGALAIVFALLGGIGMFAGGMGAVANETDSCGAASDDGAFTGMSDPDAPYDLRFIDEMVMHHQGAIMSSEMMIGDSERPELRDLAQRIQKSQQRQIDQMLAWRAEWYTDAATPAMSMDGDAATPTMDMGQETGSMGGMMDGGGMMGMMGGMMDGEMTNQMFLRMMIPHHQLAVEMAEDALANAQHAELKTLAQEIIDGQSAEITEMEGYLSEWYDEASTRGLADDMLGMMQSMMGGC
jgi:uncharacterized protein (DUF305 family)